jgi:hypothetical protein
MTTAHTHPRPAQPSWLRKLAVPALILALLVALAEGGLRFAALAVGAGALLAALVAWQRRRQRRFIEDFVFPAFLLRKLHARRPALSEAQVGEVARGLKQFFRVCQEARGAYVAMPSEAADALWHEFILHTRGYEAFCRGAFGRVLHHQPAEAMPPDNGAKAAAGLRRAWKLACRLETIDARVPARLPLLFALDASLGWPGGHRYDAQELAARGARYKKGEGSQPCVTGCGSGCGSGGSGGGGGDGCGGGGGGCGGGD